MKQTFKVFPLLTGLVFLISACSSYLTITNSTKAPTSQPGLVSTPTITQVVQIQSTSTPQPTLPSSQTFPQAENYTWNLVVTGFDRPVSLANAQDGTGRIFVVEQAGVIQVVSQGEIRPNPFLDIRDRVGSKGNEQGLLGLAFHPRFIQNGFFYLNYTDRQGNTVVSRFTADLSSPPDSQVADPRSEQVLLGVKQPFSNHNGGQLAFGPDGLLWIGLGDGGSAGDPYGNGQSTQTLLGKILRIDVDHGTPYAIPTDNPFTNGGGLPEIWAYGLRNPWRFAFDSQTGDLFIADVGQDLWEEVDFLPSGFSNIPANFGWNFREGKHPYLDNGSAVASNLVEPVFEYGHDPACSITGGQVYRGSSLPAFYGIYLFADYCSGSIWGLIHDDSTSWQDQLLFKTHFHISSFGVDETGEIYLFDLGTGLYRLEAR